MRTEDFKTKTINKKRPNIGGVTQWGIALDIGYSAVKGFCKNQVFSFPSYAKKLDSEIIPIGDVINTDIQYRDCESGELWAVGESAQNMIAINDSEDSELTLYGRNRYFSPLFKVIARVGMGLGLQTNEFGSPNDLETVIQTGLPPRYIKMDADLLREVLAGRHVFDIKVSTGQWQHFDITIKQENIRIISQPMGTLMSVANGSDGKVTVEGKKYFNSKVLIFDPGFGTLDCFSMKNRLNDNNETFDNLGMKRVMQETVKEIFDKFKVEVTVPAIQKFLTTGKIPYLDRKKRHTEFVDFTEILEEKSRKVCLEAMGKIMEMYNYLTEYDYLIITGGTGAAWNLCIRDYLKDFNTLKVLSGNQNDSLPYIFSNVRGYYMYLMSKIK